MTTAALSPVRIMYFGIANLEVFALQEGNSRGCSRKGLFITVFARRIIHRLRTQSDGVIEL